MTPTAIDVAVNRDVIDNRIGSDAITLVREMALNRFAGIAATYHERFNRLRNRAV